MPEQINRASDHKQSKAQSVGARRVKPVKGFKNLRELIGRNSDACIVNLDFQQRSPAATSDENSSAELVYFSAFRIRLRKMPSSKTASLMTAA